MKIFSDMVNRLYSGCATVEPPDFRQWALEQITDVIPFDSAVWVSGALVEGVPRTYDVYLHNQAAGFMENYSRFAHQDHLLEQVMCAPGHTVDLFDGMSRKSWMELDIYEKHSRVYGIEQAIATAVLDPVTRIFSFISLYRKDPDHPYSVEEKALKQVLSLHLVGSDRLNQQLDIRKQKTGIDSNESFASCDTNGVLVFCEGRFVEYLRRVWPKWQGPSLPPVLLNRLGDSKPQVYSESGHLFRVAPWHRGFMVFARERTPLDLLSARELEIARELAKGDSYKQIAKCLGISPSTVTNHTNAIYRKLGITSKPQLTTILGAS